MEKLTLLNFSIVLLLFLGTTIGRCQAVVRHTICWQPHHVAQIVSENLQNSWDLKKFMIVGPIFIPRNTTQLNEQTSAKQGPFGLKTRTCNYWLWCVRASRMALMFHGTNTWASGRATSVQDVPRNSLTWKKKKIQILYIII